MDIRQHLGPNLRKKRKADIIYIFPKQKKSQKNFFRTHGLIGLFN
jgi:hypothetical protein